MAKEKFPKSMEPTSDSANSFFIRNSRSVEEVAEEFGEAYANDYESRLADFVKKPIPKKFEGFIPRRTEYPTSNQRMAIDWIREFYQKNGMNMPAELRDPLKEVAVKHIYFLCKEYNFTLEDTINKRI